MKKTFNKYKRQISFYLRKKVNKKYVIIESDDWGLERAKDEKSLERIIEKYGERNISRWTKDALETTEDLEMAFDLFDYYRDKFDSGPILTANFITHNLDYSSKNELKFKPISEGFNTSSNKLFDKYREGIKRNIFFPQLHGFIHYNTKLITDDFSSPSFVEDFETGFPLAKSTIKGFYNTYRFEYLDPNFNENFIRAVQVFKQSFGYYSRTFIPANYGYNQALNGILFKNHIKLLQSGIQLVSQDGTNFLNPAFRKNKKLIYSMRNSRLDTHADYNFLADNCINNIEGAFFNKVPAIIDIHRVNFSGRFSPETRQMTIDELDKVFRYLSVNHPDTIFLSSDNLINILMGN